MNRNSNFRARAWKAASARAAVDQVISALWVNAVLVVISMGASACNPDPCKNANDICERMYEERPFPEGDKKCIKAIRDLAGCVITAEDCSPDTMDSCSIGDYCNDGVVDPGEECDDGDLNSDTQPDACRTDCSAPSCGDGVQDTGEGCDDGNNTDGDGCQADCTLPTCGDGILDPGEACDEGDANSDTAPDTCRTNCVLPFCGDDVTDTGEECDDGNTADGDGCRADCTFEVCGDGILDPGEECDQGAANSDTQPDSCRTDCTLASCGDNVQDTGEACDDGNNTDGDGCQADCTLPFCGDGIIDPGETCDDGNGDNCDTCTTFCDLPTCGDGFTCPGLGEECDDGNLVNGDGCENDCTVTPAGTFEITLAFVSPDLNETGGVRPRYTDDMAIDAFVQTTEGMTSVQAEVLNCSPAEVSDCTPVSDAPPSATSWSLRLPGFTGSPSGPLFSVQVTAEGPGGQVDQQTVDFEVYPVDAGLDVTCTKRYDMGSLYVAFTLVDNGNLPINPDTSLPYTLADMYDARFSVYQEGEETGFALDETDPIRNDFILIQPTEFNLNDDGIYEMIFAGHLNFVEPIQTHLLIDTIGGPNDVCTLVP